MTRPLVLALLFSAGACATYRARPLAKTDPAGRFNERRLDGSALRSVLDSAGVRPSAAGWSDWELAQAAWLLRPERARLAAEVRVARAARITAGARPRPGVATGTEYSFSGTGGESRWGLAVSGVFAVELGGKRGARVGRANAGVLVAVARSEAEAWEVRWRVHEAAVRSVISARLAAAAAGERDLSDSLLGLVRRRYDEGVLAATELARAEAGRQAAAAEVASRDRERTEDRAALAAAIGVPLNELDRTALAAIAPAECGSAAPRDSLQRFALEARRSLRRVLAEYQVAEADLRVEVANSWPDLQLGPGLFFDHGVGKWTIGFGLPSLPRHGNRGPIAEAEARREVAGRRVAEVQEEILDDVERAVAGCVAATAESNALDLSGIRRQLRLLDSTEARGETGRLEVGLARLEVARAERRLTEVQGRLALAGLALERAIGLWGPATALAAEREGR